MRIKGYPSERLNNTEMLSRRKTKNGPTGKFIRVVEKWQITNKN